MKNKKLLTALIVVVLAVVVSCATALAQSPVYTGVKIGEISGKFGNENEIYRIVDKDASVICWVYYSGGYRGGISCLPSRDTSLDWR